MFRTVHLTSADILDLQATPFELVPAPGPGKVIIPLSAYGRTANVTVPYTIVGSVDMRLSADAVNHGLSIADLLAEPANANAVFGVAFVPIDDLAFGDYANVPLVMDALSGSPLAGDGDLTFTVVYQVIDL